MSEEDGEIVVTEFGPIDRRSRGLLGYLLLVIMFGIATGISWDLLTTPEMQMSGGFTFAIIIMIYGLCLGIPAIAFFGNKPPPSTARHRTSRASSTARRPRVRRKTTESGGGFTETVSYAEESPQTSETVVEGLELEKTDKKQNAPDFSYRGEYPTKKARK